MTSLRLGTSALDFLNPNGLVRPAIEKFVGAWFACFVVMAHGNFARAFSFEHARLASICGTIGALVAVILLAQMDRKTNSLSRQMTISVFATFIGDVFAHPSHFPPQWGEPLVTAGVSGAIAVALWYGRRLVKSW